MNPAMRRNAMHDLRVYMAEENLDDLLENWIVWGYVSHSGEEMYFAKHATHATLYCWTEISGWEEAEALNTYEVER